MRHYLNHPSVSGNIMFAMVQSQQKTVFFSEAILMHHRDSLIMAVLLFFFWSSIFAFFHFSLNHVEVCSRFDDKKCANSQSGFRFGLGFPALRHCPEAIPARSLCRQTVERRREEYILIFASRMKQTLWYQGSSFTTYRWLVWFFGPAAWLLINFCIARAHQNEPNIRRWVDCLFHVGKCIWQRRMRKLGVCVCVYVCVCVFFFFASA